jgi:hypothetical protein
MISISDTAGQEITKVLQTEQAKGKMIYVSFMGYG